jgi:NAD(P)-dependent dehydrogenase (short-subunit alcohol dehydrogenase family)
MLVPEGRDTIAWVTGGASGLGAAIARLFADAGHRVVLTDIDFDRGTALAQEIGPPPYRLRQGPALQFTLLFARSREPDVTRMVAETRPGMRSSAVLADCGTIRLMPARAKA